MSTTTLFLIQPPKHMELSAKAHVWTFYNKWGIEGE